MIDVAIIDYQMSNLHSVQSACKYVGLSSKITSNAEEIIDSRIAILPGVGAFGEAMNQLKISKLDKCILRFIDTGKPFFGICLGFQLLFEESEEFGNYKGLGVIKGSSKKFSFSNQNNIKYPVPQIGWNKIQKETLGWDNTIFQNNTNGDYMYFVHSYFVVPENPDIILASTQYGEQKYCSSIKYNNIFATQFHPEKSGRKGLLIYKYLKEIIKKDIQ